MLCEQDGRRSWRKAIIPVKRNLHFVPPDLWLGERDQNSPRHGQTFILLSAMARQSSGAHPHSSPDRQRGG